MMKVTGSQYWDIHTDVRDAKYDPLKHYLDFGQKEGRQVDIEDPPFLPVDWDWQVYVAAYQDLQDAKIDTQEKAEAHYLANGYYEHRWPVPSQGWKPPTAPGLHLILNLPGSQRPLFAGMRFDKGLLIGDYGGHLDGAQIQYWDGATLVTEHKFSDPKGESVFHMIPADDGVPICSIERYGMMARRDTGNPADPWRRTRDVDEPSDLAFEISKMNGALYCLVCTSARPTSSVIESGDQGKTWHGRWNFPEGERTQGSSGSDGHLILFGDKENNRPVIRGVGSGLVARQDALPGHGYTQVCGKDGQWLFSGNRIDAPFGAFVDYWNGTGNPVTVFNSDRRYAMWSEAYNNIRVVLFGAWKENDLYSQVAFSLDHGKPGTWNQFTVPCNCLFRSHIADNGVYLFGGDWGSGRCYFYKW
jgi:hypothetical protein